MKHIALASALLLVPTTLLAQSQLDRFEEISSDMNDAMIAAMANEIDSLGGDGDIMRDADIKKVEWTDEIRTSAQCILDGYIDEVGSGAVDRMLDSMEEVVPLMASMTMTEATEGEMMDAMLPEGLTDDRTIEITKACGMMELQQEQMTETGFMEAMMAAGATVPDNN